MVNKNQKFRNNKKFWNKNQMNIGEKLEKSK